MKRRCYFSILFLLDWFHRRNFSLKLVLEKIPIIVSFIPIIWMTYMLHVRNPVKDGIDALLTWIWTFNFYIWKFIWPSVLVPVYHIPDPVSLSNPHYICSLVFFVFLIFSIIRFKDNRQWIFAVAFYFLSIFFLLKTDLIFPAFFNVNILLTYLLQVWNYIFDQLYYHYIMCNTRIYFCLQAGLKLQCIVIWITPETL